MDKGAIVASKEQHGLVECEGGKVLRVVDEVGLGGVGLDGVAVELELVLDGL